MFDGKITFSFFNKNFVEILQENHEMAIKWVISSSAKEVTKTIFAHNKLIYLPVIFATQYDTKDMSSFTTLHYDTGTEKVFFL